LREAHVLVLRLSVAVTQQGQMVGTICSNATISWGFALLPAQGDGVFHRDHFECGTGKALEIPVTYGNSLNEPINSR
jgi:hypothetical protein